MQSKVFGMNRIESWNNARAGSMPKSCLLSGDKLQIDDFFLRTCSVRFKYHVSPIRFIVFQNSQSLKPLNKSPFTMAKFRHSIIISIAALLCLTPNAVNALQAILVWYQNLDHVVFLHENSLKNLSSNIDNTNSTLKKMASAPLFKTIIMAGTTSFVGWERGLSKQTNAVSIESPYIQGFPRILIPRRRPGLNIPNNMSGRDLQISALMQKAVSNPVSLLALPRTWIS